MPSPKSGRAGRPSRRLVLLGLAVVCLGFAAYGSLVPLRLRPVPVAEAMDRFASTPLVPFSRASKTDFVANVALFFPVGFFLAGAVSDRSRAGAMAALPLVLVVSAGASVAIEFSQIFAAGRTPSWNDVTAETLGGLIGGVGWLVTGPRIADWVAAVARPQASDSLLTRLLGLYAALWALLGILPLDFTLRPAEVAQKLRAGRLVLVPLTGARTLSDAVQDAAGTMLMAVPIGVLAAMLVRERGAAGAWLGAGLLGVAAVAGLELLQVFLVSRTADVTDVISGGLGVAAGVLLAHRWARGRWPAGDGGRAWPLAALAVWALVLLVRHWSPFEFTREAAVVEQRMRTLPWVPFQSYYWARPLDSLMEATTKVLLGVPVGSLLQLAWRVPGAPAARAAQAAVLVAIAGAFFAGVELGQVLLPARVPDPTDIWLGISGAALGVAAARRLAR